MRDFRPPPALSLLLFCLSWSTWASSSIYDQSMPWYPRSKGGIHLPIIRKEVHSVQKRVGQASAIGLGDILDFRYIVSMNVGSITASLELDTGSSDLWVLSDACIHCETQLPLYPQAMFKPVGLNVLLLYGLSYATTYAYGSIGRETVGLAGLTIPDLYFAAVNDTNTSTIYWGSTGIFGLGFPLNSNIWYDVYNNSLYARGTHNSIALAHRPSRFPPTTGYHPFDPITAPNPSLKYSPSQPLARQSNSPSTIDAILASLEPASPLLPRLVLSGELAEPIFTITLQRDKIDLGGNIGLLSIGELPQGVRAESLTWTNLRLYDLVELRFLPPTQMPNELYPLPWEVFIDDIYFDGEKLPRSGLVSPSIRLSALVDTGDPLIRGPQDVINFIYFRLGGTLFPCSIPHTLAFQIGGHMFPVDPRDFIRPALVNSVESCRANIAIEDIPGEGQGYLYSWSLGDPFLKSVFAAFYFGNITHPSKDLPRMGFLSTVPPDADQKLREAVAAAQANGGKFPAVNETAPTGIFSSTRATTNGGGPTSQVTVSASSASDGVSNSESKLRIGALERAAFYALWLLLCHRDGSLLATWL